MSRPEFTVTHERYTVDEILAGLENVDDGLQRLTYVTSPIDNGDTDVDSDQSDDEHEANLNHLGRRMLQSTCEVQTAYSNDTVPVHEEPQVSTINSTVSADNSSISVEVPVGDSGDLVEDLKCDGPTINAADTINAAFSIQPRASTSNINDPYIIQQEDADGNQARRPKRKRKKINYLDDGNDDGSPSPKKQVKITKITSKTKPKNVTKSKKSDKPTTTPKPKTKKELAEELKKARIAQWKTCEPSFSMVMDCNPIPPSDDAMECETQQPKPLQGVR